MIISEDDYLAHYGILRRSGRYPWGSGKDQATRNRDFLDTVADLRKKGLNDAEIARGFGISRNELTAARTIAKAQQKADQIRTAQRLKDKGMSTSAIGRQMGLNESSVRSLLDPGQKEKTDILQRTADMLRDQVAKKTYVDIGRGVEASLPISGDTNIGISKEKLNAAVSLLKEEGYEVHRVKQPQVGTGQLTEFKVLSPPGTTQKDVWLNRDKIQQIQDFSDNGGRGWLGIKPPLSISPSRVGIRYAEDGGANADGVIFVRRGAKDLDLGGARYAQVRIAVGPDHYLKGMAIYKDDMPEGVDLLFNTNKSNTGNKLDAMKKMNRDPNDPSKIDPDMPFGAAIKAGGQRGAMNIVNEEGDWDTWSRNLPSQMLSKQSPALVKSQLEVTYERRQRELDEIMSLTNPSVRKKLLESYADGADSAAVHLKAAALPRQATKVILPVPSMKETEVFAPSMRDGERVALVRFPHGGTFEIPIVTVNNKNREARKLIGTDARDAIGIHPKVAERLSGADFDGDSVLVIPNDRGHVKNSPALEGLKGFDPQIYKIPEGSGIPGIGNAKQSEMGKVTNLIADMTLRGASNDEIARAVRHSMVVIDAEKHNLDHRASARDNGIAQLKTKYQGGPNAGAKTLITRATSEVRIPERAPRKASEGGPIDKATGKKVFVETGRTFVDRKTGEVKKSTMKVQRLAIEDDAHKLSSGTPTENLYADYSNRVKALANAARKEAVNTQATPQSKTAKETYAKEVASLNSKLNVAKKNAPLERQAQVIANATVSQKRKANPNMEEATVKKIKSQALAEARVRTGAKKQRIEITQAEWNAIQAGAISKSKLDEILNNADLDIVRELATPKTKLTITPAKESRAKLLLANGYSLADVADQLGVTVSTLNAVVKVGDVSHADE